jgi:hypothetical protein
MLGPLKAGRALTMPERYAPFTDNHSPSTLTCSGRRVYKFIHAGGMENEKQIR